ncbi:hypothetical protein H8356DRAFT_1653257 [Neocallimastix lanati (nom. inval.)]|nr:hypothetical protein H8356DRAFT_1653257 [Neocallimastix sp. JGI-2020a]
MMTEADRGKTMKITEPKTPFIRYNIDKDEVYGHTAAVEPVELTMALEAEKQEMPDFSLGGSNEDFENENPSDVQNDDWNDDSEEEETEEERKKREEFKKKRAEHYNMKEALALIHSHKFDDEDEDEE